MRAVKPRARMKAEALARQSEKPRAETNGSGPGEVSAEVTQSRCIETSEWASTPADDSGWEMVCRPKVGLRIDGGGFIGLWRRKDIGVESS